MFFLSFVSYLMKYSVEPDDSNLSIMIDIPGTYHYDYTDFTYFTYLTKKMNFSGSVPSDTMAKIMNTTLVDFFNHTLNINHLAINKKRP